MTSETKDYYKILGVSPSATGDEIKQAYRKKAMKYHPDRNSGKSKEEMVDSEQKFKRINEAYTILSDAQKRSAYDNFGDPSVGGGQDPFGGAGFPDLNDILNNFFGGQDSMQSQRGSDLGYQLTLSLEEAATGIEKEISVQKQSTCSTCHGSGARANSKPTTCSTCRGKGRVTLQQGFLAIQQTCPSCQGEGVSIDDPCKKCHGNGCHSDHASIKVRIPAGVDNGDRMRVSGKGDAGTRGNPSGDLYVDIQVSQHPIFERDGPDLHCQVPISFYHACVGGSVDVATLDKRVKLTIPPETQSGSMLRLRGKGMKTTRSSRQGDIICHINIETPVKLNKEQKELLKQLDHSINEDKMQHRPKTQSFLQRIKSLLG